MENLSLQSPVVCFYKRLKAFMEADKDVKVNLYYDTNEIEICVNDPVKAAAWREILPFEKKFGDTSVILEVVSEKHEVTSDVLITALYDNSNYASFYRTKDGVEYCYFEPNIIQFENDNFGSPEMLETWTAEDLAKELIGNDVQISFCTLPLNQKEDW